MVFFLSCNPHRKSAFESFRSQLVKEKKSRPGVQIVHRVQIIHRAQNIPSAQITAQSVNNALIVLSAHSAQHVLISTY